MYNMLFVMDLKTNLSWSTKKFVFTGSPVIGTMLLYLSTIWLTISPLTAPIKYSRWYIRIGPGTSKFCGH